MSTIYIIRHGESHANAGLTTFATDAIPLTPLGHEQAAQVPNKLPNHIDLILHSNYLRTKETAMPTIEKFPNTLVKIWDSIHEFTYLDPVQCFGTNMEERKPIVDAFWNARNPYLQVHPNTESFEQFIGRVKETHSLLRHEFGGANKTVAMFTHALFIKAFFQVEEQPTAPVQKLMDEFFDCPVIKNCDIFEYTV